MKQGWEIKKLGEVADITDYVANGSFATLRENVSYLDKPGYAILVRLADYTNNFDRSKFVYIDEHAYGFLAKSKLYGGEIIMSNVGSIGKSFICPNLGMPMSLAPNSIVIKTAYNAFYYYLFQSESFQIALKGISSQTALPKFNKTSFKKIEVPVPPLPEQEKIVAELDCLSGIIEKKRQQLKELDALAQSIFYEMFGDPVTNEKGWEIKKLGEVCESDLGKTLNQSKDTGELYPYLCAINVLWDKIDFTTIKQTKFEKSELERYSVQKGDLLICEGGDIGRAAIWNKDEAMLYQNALHRVRFDGTVIPRFCLLYLRFLKDIGILDSQYGKGVTIKHLVKSSLLSIPIPVPPLPLQQEFASKIEAIEKQKELIKQSLGEVETLFNARMQEYFG